MQNQARSSSCARGRCLAADLAAVESEATWLDEEVRRGTSLLREEFVLISLDSFLWCHLENYIFNQMGAYKF